MQTHHDLTAWRHTQINVKPDLVFIDLAQLVFRLAYKNNHWDGIDCHTPVILQLSGGQVINLSYEKRKLTKCFILFNLKSFLKLFTSFWYTL